MSDSAAAIAPVDLKAYRNAARIWLADHTPRFSGQARADLSMVQDLALGRAWQALKADAGYACITLPRNYGGGGRGELEKIVFGEEELHYDLPTVYFGVSLVPMMLRYAAPAVRDRLVPRAIRGDDFGCQLSSKPAAGSDLAALRLRATPVERDGIPVSCSMGRSCGRAGRNMPHGES